MQNIAKYKEKHLEKIKDFMSSNEFAHLGDGQVAYIRTVDQDEACRLYPGFEGVAQDIILFSLHGADGTPIVLTDNKDAAIADATENNLETVAVH